MEGLPSAPGVASTSRESSPAFATPWSWRRSRMTPTLFAARIGSGGSMLELVVLDRSQGLAVIHAMAMRAKYRRLLPKK